MSKADENNGRDSGCSDAVCYADKIRRWGFDIIDNEIWVCEGNHEKGEHCEAHHRKLESAELLNIIERLRH